MDRIRELARLSVLRASAFSMLAISLGMMGMMHDPPFSLRVGAAGMLILAAVLTLVGVSYHRRRRIQDTEVWIMMRPEERPPKAVARVAITRAMRAELLEKALWSAKGALGLLGLSLLLMLL